MKNRRGMEKTVINPKLLAWIMLSRPPFHTVGILPSILGTILAWKLDGIFHPSVFLLGVLAVILIMLSTYHAGEYYDYEGDVLSQKFSKNRFAGGSGIMPAGTVPLKVSLWTSVITFLLAGAIGLFLQFCLNTGQYTLLLGCLGAFPGFFYSTRPIRLIERGWGEIFIVFCYGWLPVASAFYIQSGDIAPIIHWISIPIGLSIFNVIFLNEFPDYEADRIVNKRNLLVRIGKGKGVLLYIALSFLMWASMLYTLVIGVDWKALYIFIPVLFLSLYIIFMLLRKKHEDPRMLERLCGMNIAVNLGTTASYILAYL
jgi:1,4-dihydroxy-2-naphthoate polyprenyltransferase